MKIILVSISVIILVILIGSIAYLLQRPCDYQANFTVKTTPEVVYFNIYDWHIWNRKQAASKIEITGKTPVVNVSQKVSLKDTTLIFNWEIKRLNDSVSTVRVCVSDPDRKIFNHLTAPFITTPFKKSLRNNLLDIMKRMDLMLTSFQYEFTGPAHFNETACVYINLNNTVRGKAKSMISTVAELNQFVRKYNLELNGHPFVVIHDWNELSDTINFDFCFPIKNAEAVPEHTEIKFKRVREMDAIKTNFYGNYSISDITWYNLAEEARKLGSQDKLKLIEVYHNDPHSGGNELEWKAEIFLGIESDN
jgi:effector-binding domain-containing protein